MALHTSQPEGRDFTINIYRDLVMISARNNSMRPYTELIVSWLDAYCNRTISEYDLHDKFEKLSKAANADDCAKHFATRAVSYMQDEYEHNEFMNAQLPF